MYIPPPAPSGQVCPSNSMMDPEKSNVVTRRVAVLSLRHSLSSWGEFAGAMASLSAITQSSEFLLGSLNISLQSLF